MQTAREQQKKDLRKKLTEIKLYFEITIGNERMIRLSLNWSFEMDFYADTITL